jgi:hypothetical protein
MVTELIEQGRREREQRILSLDEESRSWSIGNEGAA